jgi:7-cyano-7-deazaguanine reductase
MSENNEQNLDGVTLLGNQNTKYKFDYDPSILERFEKKFDESNPDEQIVNLDCFEFASRCPKTGQPDFATIHISYIPNTYMVESKSLKLYLFSFQQHGDFHESCIHMIMQDLVDLLDPKFLAVYGDFNSRGGISILPLSIYADDEHQDLKKSIQIQTMVENMKHKPRTC